MTRGDDRDRHPRAGLSRLFVASDRHARVSTPDSPTNHHTTTAHVTVTVDRAADDVVTAATDLDRPRSPIRVPNVRGRSVGRSLVGVDV